MVTWVALAALIPFSGRPAAASLLAATFGGRVSQKTGVSHIGKLVEAGPTGELFTTPRATRTQDFITGRFG